MKNNCKYKVRKRIGFAYHDTIKIPYSYYKVAHKGRTFNCLTYEEARLYKRQLSTELKIPIKEIYIDRERDWNGIAIHTRHEFEEQIPIRKTKKESLTKEQKKLMNSIFFGEESLYFIPKTKKSPAHYLSSYTKIRFQCSTVEALVKKGKLVKKLRTQFAPWVKDIKSQRKRYVTTA